MIENSKDILFKCNVCGELSLERFNSNEHIKIIDKNNYYNSYFIKSECSNCGNDGISGNDRFIL